MSGPFRRFAAPVPSPARLPDPARPPRPARVQRSSPVRGDTEVPAAVPESAPVSPGVIPNELVDAARCGDRAALQRLISLIHPHVVRYCRARVTPDHRGLSGADDVTQEVCLAVVSALPGYHRRSTPFLAFVYGIAAHKVADAHRASARTHSVPVPELPEQPDDQVTPEQQALRSATADRIEEILATLPHQQREILRLRVVVGLTADQTAMVLSTTAGAVRVAQHRALGRLRALLTAAGEGSVGAGGWAEVVG